MFIDCAVVGRRVSMDHSSRLDFVVSSRSSRVTLSSHCIQYTINQH